MWQQLECANFFWETMMIWGRVVAFTHENYRSSV
jgi:hypothetical protein